MILSRGYTVYFRSHSISRLIYTAIIIKQNVCLSKWTAKLFHRTRNTSILYITGRGIMYIFSHQNLKLTSSELGESRYYKPGSGRRVIPDSWNKVDRRSRNSPILRILNIITINWSTKYDEISYGKQSHRRWQWILVYIQTSDILHRTSACYFH